MITQIITDDIRRAAGILRAGGLVAVPTETVYGLAASGLDPGAVRRLYAVKGRPAAKPLSLLVAGPDALGRLCVDVPHAAYALAERFWPGPLTMVLKAGPDVPDIVRAGGETVGLRCPDSDRTLALLRECGVPLAAPSANPSGAASPQTARQVLAYFDGRIDAVLDGGPCALGTESTVVDLTTRPWRVLRQGALPEAAIRAALMDSLVLVGVTGGTGAGKTTALGCLADLGALVLDADAVYHDLCRDSADMLRAIEARFPGTIREGILRRKELGRLVFSDPAALSDLRAITDAYVGRELERRCAEYAAAGGTCAAIDAINLLDTPLRARLRAVVGVVAPEEERVRRLVAREGVTADYARLRIRAQPPDAYFEQNCDHILFNDGDIDQFRRRCGALFTQILMQQEE